MSGSKGLNLQELAHRWEKDLLSPTLRKNRRLLGCSSYWRISKNGSFARVYLLYGEETYLRLQYRDKLKKALIPDGDTMNYHYF